MTDHINVEQLVSHATEENLKPILVDDFLTLVKTVTRNTPLLKDVWAKTILDDLNLFAVFGMPDSDEWLVTLVAEEQSQ